MRNGQKFCAAVFVILTMLLAPGTLFADVTGSIVGVVRDRAQAVVTSAHITVTNVQTNLSQEITSGPDGSYHFLALPAGTYRLTANAPSFRTFTATDIILQVKDQLKIDVVLDVGAVNEQVNVAADLTHVETESTQLGDVIDSKKMLAPPSTAAATLICWAYRRVWRRPGQ